MLLSNREGLIVSIIQSKAESLLLCKELNVSWTYLRILVSFVSLFKLPSSLWKTNTNQISLFKVTPRSRVLLLLQFWCAGKPEMVTAFFHWSRSGFRVLAEDIAFHRTQGRTGGGWHDRYSYSHEKLINTRRWAALVVILVMWAWPLQRPATSFCCMLQPVVHEVWYKSLLLLFSWMGLWLQGPRVGGGGTNPPCLGSNGLYQLSEMIDMLDILPLYSDEMDSGFVFLLTLCDQFMGSCSVPCSNISEYCTGGRVWRLLSCRHVDNQKLL